MMTHCFVKIVEYFHLTSIQKEKEKDGTLKRDRHCLIQLCVDRFDVSFP